MSQKDKSIGENIIWNTVGLLVLMICQWLITVFTVKIGGYEMGGYLTVAMTISILYYTFACFTTRSFQVTDMNGKYSDSTYLVSRILTSAIGWIILPFILLSGKYSLQQNICIIIFIAIKLVEAMIDVMHGVDQKANRMDIIGISSLLRGLFSLGIFLLMFKISLNLALSLFGMLAVTIIVGITYDYRKFKLFFKGQMICEKEKIKNLLVESFPLFMVTFLSTLVPSIPKLFLEAMNSSEELGIYTAIAAPALIVQAAANFIFVPFLGSFAYAYHQKDDKSFKKLFGICCAILIGISIITINGAKLLGDFGLEILYGEYILEYSYLLIPTIITTILTAFTYLLFAILTVIRDFKSQVIANVITVVLCLIGSNYFIRSKSIVGVNIALLIALGFEVAFLLLIIIKMFKRLTIKDQF
ncbi:MAG: lipopolysaccharide biosynthesis protein [Lachnospiraceae bacterium]|nr:lipopolysaccharide biosynthesis protein [Lachnospiraceae bacterium]